MQSGVQGGTQAPAVPQATGGVPGTGPPSDTAHDPRVIFSNVSNRLFLPSIPRWIYDMLILLRTRDFR